MANLSLDYIHKITKRYDEDKEIAREQKAKMTNAAPIHREVPTLKKYSPSSREAEEQRSAKAVQQRNTQIQNDIMAQAESLSQLRNTPQMDMSMPSQPISFGNTSAPTDINLGNSPASSLAGFQSDIDNYNRILETNSQASVDDPIVDTYLDPSYRLSKDEEKVAKSIVDNYFNENPDAKKMLHMSSSNPNRASKIRAEMTEKERRDYDRITSLMNKTSNLSAYTYGMLNIMPFGNTAMNKMGEMMGVDPQYNYSAQKQNLKTQSPVAYMGGDMTSKMAAYSVLGKALEGIPALGEATNYMGNSLALGREGLGNAIGNIARGTIADIALDTLPTEIENYKNGMSAGDIAKDTLGNIAINTAFNAGAEGLGQLIKNIGNKKALNQVGETFDDVARNAEEVPRLSNLDQERLALESRADDMEALRAEMARKAEADRAEAFRNRPRANLNAEQASNVDNMSVLRQAMEEQQAQVAREEAERITREQATSEVPRVGSEPSLIKEETPVEQIAKTEAPTDVADVAQNASQTAQTAPTDIQKPKKFFEYVNTKKMQKDIHFNNDADKAAFESARKDLFSKYQKVMSKPTFDNIQEFERSYRQATEAASKGFMNDYSYRDTYKNLKKQFIDRTKGMTIKLSESDLAELPDETITSLNKKLSTLGNNTGIKFSKSKGIGIDSLWDDIVEASGNQLSADNTQDMVRQLLDYVDGLKTRIDNPEIEQFPADLNMFIPDEMWDDIAQYATRYDDALKAGDIPASNRVIAEDIGINPKTTFEDDIGESAIIEGEVPQDIVRPGEYTLEFDTSAPREGTEKVSKTYTNTGKNSNGWNETEYNKYTDPNHYTYESKSELDSINEATRMREDEGRELFKKRVLEKENLTGAELDGLMMEWRETVQDAREIEASGGDASALWSESNRIFKKIQTESTQNAQALQALAKWSRNTPEGLLMHTENIVNGKVKASKGELQKFLDKFAKKNKDIEFSPDFQKNFLEEAEKLQDLDLNSKEAKDIMGRLGKMTNAELPVKLNEKLQSLLMDNMLGNFRTLITRNAGGNIGLNAVEQTAQRPLAAAIDRLVSHKTGIRTQAGMTKEGLQEYMSGFKKGLADEIHDIRTGLHTSRTGENTIENALNANRHVFKNKILDKFDSFVKNGLSIGDRPFYEAVYKQTLGDYNRLRATGQMGDIVNSLSDADFNTYAETAAHLNALTAVYQNDSAMSQALLGFKRSIGQLSEGTVGFDILSQFSMPFVKTPANVVDRAIDYSPLGLVRNIARTTREGGIGGANFDQNRFVNELSRNILGTGLMGGAAVAAGRNILNGAYSDDVDEKQLQKQSGMQEYALNIPTLDGKNYNMDISWLPVVGSNAVAAAAAVDAYRNGEGNVLNNIGSGLVQGGEALFDQSMFQGLQRLFGADNSYNSDTGIVGNALNTVKSGAGQLIPSLARQIAQVSDPYQRDVSNSNGGNYDVNSIINNIPGARQNLLAPKVDANGNLMEESQGRGMGMRFLEDMILPGKITEVTSHELDEEAVRLSDETGSEASFRPKPYRKDIDADKKLTNEEWVAYEQKFNSALTEAGNTVINSDAYKGLNAEAQNNLLSNVYKSVKSAINSEYNGKELSGGAKAYAEAGGGEAGIQAVVDYHTKGAVAKEKGLSNNNATQAIYDADGEQGLDDYAVIKEAGGNKKSYDQFNYYNSQAGSQTVPTLDSTSYMKKVGEIEKYNKDKKTNGLVSQQELADYLNAQKYNSSKADAYVKAFFGDDYIAYTTKKGRIGIKKKE